MATIYRLWGERDDKRLTESVMGCLSVYGYGALPSDPTQAAVKVRMFSLALSDEPIWAVEAAVLRWIKTQHKEPPTPAALLDAVRHEKGYYDTFKGEWVGRIYDKLSGWLKETKEA